MFERGDRVYVTTLFSKLRGQAGVVQMATGRKVKVVFPGDPTVYEFKPSDLTGE
jgi:precorrin-6B methylase 1